MRHAPPVSYPVGRFSWWLGAHALLWIAGALTLVGWTCTNERTLQMAPALAALMVMLAWVNWRAWINLPTGLLSWHEGRWVWRAGDAGAPPWEGALVRQWDMQGFMLIRLKSADGRSVWLCLRRKAAPERWHDLRRAVYSRAMNGNPRLQ